MSELINARDTKVDDTVEIIKIKKETIRAKVHTSERSIVLDDGWFLSVKTDDGDYETFHIPNSGPDRSGTEYEVKRVEKDPLAWPPQNGDVWITNYREHVFIASEGKFKCFWSNMGPTEYEFEDILTAYRSNGLSLLRRMKEGR